MKIEEDKRKDLGNFFKVLLAKIGLKQVQIAEICGVTRQRISQIFNGRETIPPEKFNKIYDFFKEKGIAESDLNKLVQLFVSSKMNIDVNKLKKETTPIKQLIIDDLELMDDEALYSLRRAQEKLLK